MTTTPSPRTPTADEILLSLMLQNSIEYTALELERIENEYYEDDLDEQIESYKKNLAEQRDLLNRFEAQGFVIENLRPAEDV